MNRPVSIVVVDTPESSGLDLSVEREQLPGYTGIRRFTWRGDAGKLAHACRDADAVLVSYAPFDREIMSQMPGCELISVAATGWDCIDIDAAKELGISVCCVGEYCTDEVADHALALILALNRQLLDYHGQVQQRKSWAYDEVTGIRRLAGQRLGIIGLGRIGEAVATRARGFGLEVVAFDPWLVETGRDIGIPLLRLDELLASSDIISLHCALDADNAGMINRKAFARMRRRPMLVNVARGGLIDEHALSEALDTGLISGAALDVLSEEPPVLEGHLLLGRSNVIVTPHVAFYSEDSLLENRTISAQNIRCFFEGRPEDVFRWVHHAEKD